MISKSDKRFLVYWTDQRSGSKFEYYFQYTIAWSIVAFLSLFFLTKLVMTARDMGGWTSFFIIVPVSVVGALVFTHFNYRANEKRYKKLNGK